MNLIKQTVRSIHGFFSKRSAYAPDEQSLQGELQKIIGYTFKDISLLQQACTHTSYLNSEQQKGLQSNERLEFLGDAVLNFLVTEYLYLHYPGKPEGYLSKIKSLVVSRKILGEIAFSLNIGQYLSLGNSEIKTGGKRRRSILSNAFEALLGAVYLDGGIVEAKGMLQRYLFCRINEFLKDTSNINYKSKILELSQQDGFGVPDYTVVSTSGPDHAKNFHVQIQIAGVALGEGKGTNKKIAQQKAAQQAIGRYSKEKILSQNKKGAQND
jgi:ribonuclease-3